MDFNIMLKIVFLILIANSVDFCQGKAFSEAEKVRGKRYYNHDQSPGLHQTYDSQSNAERWMKGKFYEPEVDGQPIYIPPIGGNYNEFLDSYYKSYTPEGNRATPGPPTYDTKSIKNSKESVVKISSDKDNVKYVIPKKTKLTVTMSPSDDYDAPEIVDKTTGVVFSNGNSDVSEESSDVSEEDQLTVEMSQTEDYNNPESEDYDAPVVVHKTIATELGNEKSDLENPESIEISKPDFLESLKKTELPKPEDDSLYEKPVIKAVKQKPKTNVKKSAQEKTNLYETSPLITEDYEEPIVYKVVKAKPSKSLTSPPALKYNDQTKPSQSTRKKSKGKLRKQYSKSNKPKIEDVVDLQSTIKPKTVEETSYEQSKSDYIYSPKDIPTKEKVVVKTDQKVKPVKTKEKVVVKTNSEKKKIKTSSNKPVKTKEKVKPDLNDKPLKEKSQIKYDEKELEKDLVKRLLNDETDSVVSNMSTDRPLEEYDLVDSFDTNESESSGNNLISDEPTEMKSNLNSGTSKNETEEEKDSIFPNPKDFRGLSSMNSNIWSMLFNPHAEQNRLKQKRCITRSNETGFCTYIQNCEVPHIATSLEQLLNNACVIDDIFIGVCCPEFPVQSVKVHWDQTPSDFDNQVEDEFGNNVEDCGVRSNEASELESWPWKAPLVSMSNGKIFCGGIVVSQDHVLTAAHCTTKIPKNQILVRLGQYDDGSGDDYAVIEIKRHAQYNPRTLTNDVALLKLGRRIMNDAHIGMVCLPDEDGKNDHDGETATLLGWRGIFGTKSRDPEFLEVISNRDCANRLGMKVSSTLLCTETRKESERTCNADSGAPLVIEENGKYEVIGILSWNRNDCNQRFPSTFSRVSSYTKWIKNHIA